MTCTERVLHYIREIPQEASDRSAFPPPNSWPDSGCIELRDLSMRYRPETPLVLKGISVNIGGGQRVGIVGRTGSGKSSLLTSILRLVESEVSPQFGGGGSILIDGVDTSKIGLGELRRQCAIIPQNPACFSGTIRSNLDPFDGTLAPSSRAMRPSPQRGRRRPTRRLPGLRLPNAPQNSAMSRCGVRSSAVSSALPSSRWSRAVQASRRRLWPPRSLSTAKTCPLASGSCSASRVLSCARPRF